MYSFIVPACLLWEEPRTSNHPATPRTGPARGELCSCTVLSCDFSSILARVGSSIRPGPGWLSSYLFVLLFPSPHLRGFLCCGSAFCWAPLLFILPRHTPTYTAVRYCSVIKLAGTFVGRRRRFLFWEYIFARWELAIFHNLSKSLGQIQVTPLWYARHSSCASWAVYCGSGQDGWLGVLVVMASDLATRWLRVQFPAAKWRQKGGCFFITAIFTTPNSHFFVAGQIGMKFGQKMSIGCPLLNLIEEFWKFSLKGVILLPNRHFGVALTGLRVTGLQVRGYVFRLS